jgi:hypothetical protein
MSSGGVILSSPSMMAKQRMKHNSGEQLFGKHII